MGSPDKMEEHLRELADRIDSFQPEVVAALWLAMRGPFAQPASGSWLEDIRRFRRLSAKEVGSRLGKSRQNVLYLESAEREARISLGTLKNAADALGFELVYMVVPKDDATRKLLNRLKPSLDSMAEKVLKQRKALSVLGALGSLKNAKERVESLRQQVREWAFVLLVADPEVMKPILLTDPTILSWLREQLIRDTSAEGKALLNHLQKEFTDP